MPELYLDLVNPVDVSTDPGATQGSIVGGTDALREDDGDTSYVEVSNGYDQEELGYGADGYFGYRDGGFSKTFQVDLEPDPTLPDPADVFTFDIRWVLTLRMISPGTFGYVQRNHATGFQVLGSTASTSYVEDFPRGDTYLGPTWAQIQGGGYSHPFRGAARNLLQSPWSLIRITRMRLWVSYTLGTAPITDHAAGLRNLQRGDGLEMSGAPRAVQNRSQQATLRNISFQ